MITLPEYHLKAPWHVVRAQRLVSEIVCMEDGVEEMTPPHTPYSVYKTYPRAYRLLL